MNKYLISARLQSGSPTNLPLELYLSEPLPAVLRTDPGPPSAVGSAEPAAEPSEPSAPPLPVPAGRSRSEPDPAPVHSTAEVHR